MNGRWQLPCPTCKKPITWTGSASAQPPCPVCQPVAAKMYEREQRPRQTATAAAVATKPEPSPAVEKALAQCDDIINRTEELPSRAMDFGESVADRVRGIAESIEEHGYVTTGQKQALDNMQDGVERWFR